MLNRRRYGTKNLHVYWEKTLKPIDEKKIAISWRFRVFAYPHHIEFTTVWPYLDGSSHGQLVIVDLFAQHVVNRIDSDRILYFFKPIWKSFQVHWYSHPSYSYLPNKCAGLNKHVGWKMGQNWINLQGGKMLNLNNRVG